MPEKLEQSSVAEQPGDLAAVLDEVVAEVLATMFFSDAEPCLCDHNWLHSGISAQLRFEGTHFGEALLTVSHPAAQSIAAGFLGLDPEETTEALCAHVILELANILCGAVLSRLWPESKLTLSAPVPETWLAGIDNAAHRCFNLPEGALAFFIRLQGANP